MQSARRICATNGLIHRSKSRQLRLARRQLFLSWIVSGVDVVNTSRAGELNLENRLFVACPCVMRVFCRIHPQCARLQQFAFFLELFTLARSDSTADYRYDLGIRVSVRGHLEVGGKLDA